MNFTSQNGRTVIEYNYDYQGRRFEKKITVNGSTSSHDWYLYRGYLQIAELNLMHPEPVLNKTYLWDPTEFEATRILMMTSWENQGKEVKEHLCFMHDAIKNVTSIFDEQQTRRARYEYEPFGGLLTVEGDMAQKNKFRFSCEFSDEELGLVYYNYRHLNPFDGRWISRDPIAEQGGNNLFRFIRNTLSFDTLGLTPPKEPSLSEIVLGDLISISGNVIVTVQFGQDLSTINIPITGGKATGKVSVVPASENIYTGSFNFDINAILNKNNEGKCPTLLDMTTSCPLIDKILNSYKSIKMNINSQWNIQNKKSQQFPITGSIIFGNQQDNIKFLLNYKDFQHGANSCSIGTNIKKSIFTHGKSSLFLTTGVSDITGPGNKPTYSLGGIFSYGSR